MGDGKNFPEPKTNADCIALKAAELLDQDVWERVSDSAVWVRGIRINLGSYNTSVSVPVDPNHEADILKSQQVSEPFAEAFQAAFRNAMARKRQTMLVPKLDQISNDAWERVIATEARKIFWRKFRHATAWVIIGTIAVIAATGGMVSCVKVDEAARLADSNQVNAYGFRKGDFAYVHQFEFPSSCETITNPISPRERCKQAFQEWEKEGSRWITWEGEP